MGVVLSIGSNWLSSNARGSYLLEVVIGVLCGLAIILSITAAMSSVIFWFNLFLASDIGSSLVWLLGGWLGGWLEGCLGGWLGVCLGDWL